MIMLRWYIFSLLGAGLMALAVYLAECVSTWGAWAAMIAAFFLFGKAARRLGLEDNFDG